MICQHLGQQSCAGLARAAGVGVTVSDTDTAAALADPADPGTTPRSPGRRAEGESRPNAKAATGFALSASETVCAAAVCGPPCAPGSREELPASAAGGDRRVLSLEVSSTLEEGEVDASSEVSASIN
jgi:hypothetical protein